MIQNHNAYQAGMWIQRKVDGSIGWIIETQVMKSVVYIPETGKTFLEWNTSIHKIGGSPCADDILKMMDIALLLDDKEWLRELCAAYDSQWRKEIGITS